MKPTWDDLIARARGLEGHFLDDDALRARQAAPNLEALAAALRTDGIITAELPPPLTPADVELAIRRWATAMLRIVGRWAGPRSAALPYLFDDEDRRSVRAMIRGVLQRAPAPLRLAGLIPTPALPERALGVLSRATTAAGITGHLAAWGHPFAAELAPATAVPEPDPYRLEAILDRCVTTRALAAADRAGDRTLRRYVADTIDLQNAVTALALARAGEDVTPRDLFLAGGRALKIGPFEEAIATGTAATTIGRLRPLLANVPCAGCLAVPPHEVESRLLHCRIRTLSRAALMRPLGPIAVIRFGLLLRWQVTELQRAIWTAALGAPRAAGSAVAP